MTIHSKETKYFLRCRKYNYISVIDILASTYEICLFCHREVRVKVTGKNVGYGATCECMVQAAMVILKERERLPGSGGVITPGYAFAKTSLVDRLTSAGVPFVASTRDM